MKLGMRVGLVPGNIVLDGNPAPPPSKGHSPQFSVHICCGQMAGWIKMSLGMEVGLGRGDFVLDGDPPPLLKTGAEPHPPIFGPCLLWPNGWMDQDGTWHGGGTRSRPHCARWTQLLLNQKDDRAAQFSTHFYCGQTAICIRIPLVRR